MDPFIPLNLSFSQQTTCKVQSDKTAGKPVNVFEIFHNIFSFLKSFLSKKCFQRIIGKLYSAQGISLKFEGGSVV